MVGHESALRVLRIFSVTIDKTFVYRKKRFARHFKWVFFNCLFCFLLLILAILSGFTNRRLLSRSFAINMRTRARNLKRRARVLVTDERIWSSSRSYAGAFDWVTDGIICFMLFVTIIWLCLKSKPQHFQIENTLNGIVINSELE